MSNLFEPRTIKDLEALTGKKNPKNDKTKIEEVLKKMPVRLTDFLVSLCKKSPAVAKQFFPNIKELENTGKLCTWGGVIDTGIHGLERLYLDRCIIMPFMGCPAYCRFCFRKYYETSQQMMSYKDIDKAISYIKKDKKLKSVLITGGDPLMELKRLEYILKNLRKISHIEDIRIGTRSLMYDPDRIDKNLVKMLLRYHDFAKMKPIEIGTHFNHPDEVTSESKKAITLLTKASIRVYNQAVLLKGINDDEKILSELFRKLRLLGVEIYYLFHCEPVKGMQYLRTKIQKGIDIKKHFRGGNIAGRINPAFMVSTQIGKVEIGVDGYIEKKEGKYVWIKTPYNISMYKSISKSYKLPKEICKIDKEGYISIKYLDGE